jgi:hypothetical protein
MLFYDSLVSFHDGVSNIEVKYLRIQGEDDDTLADDEGYGYLFQLLPRNFVRKTKRRSVLQLSESPDHRKLYFLARISSKYIKEKPRVKVTSFEDNFVIRVCKELPLCWN